LTAEEAEAAVEAAVGDASWAQRRVGNLYTASWPAGLASLVEARGEGLAGRRTLVFAFGSGVQATLFALRGRAAAECAAGASAPGAGASGPGGRFTLGRMQARAGLRSRLEARRFVSVAEYRGRMAALHAALAAPPPYAPPQTTDSGDGDDELPPGAFFLRAIDTSGRRSYGRVAPAAAPAAAPPDDV